MDTGFRGTGKVEGVCQYMLATAVPAFPVSSLSYLPYSGHVELYSPNLKAKTEIIFTMNTPSL